MSFSYYAIPIACPDCGGAVSIEKIGIKQDWTIAINFECVPCKKGGGQTVEIAELIQYCKEQDEEEVTVQ